jgi:hypothetical protein
MPLLERDEEIRDLLRKSGTIAVVGVSDKPWRDSHTVSLYMLNHGYTVIPVNPMISSVFNIRSVPVLADIREHVDIVNVFRRVEYVADIIADAIAIGAGAVWLQSGIHDDRSARRACDAGLSVVMDRCIRVAHTLLVR